MAVSFFAQVWLARQFGPTGLGEYSATTLYVTSVATLALAGVPLAVLERLGGLEELRDARAGDVVETAFAVTLILGGLAASLTLAIWQPIADVARLGHAPASALVAVAVLCAALQFFAVSVHIARLEMALATVLIVAQPLAVLSGIAASYATDAITGSLLALVGYFGTGIVTLASLVRERVRPRIHLAQLRALGRRFAPTSSMLYLTVLVSWIDRLIVVVLSGPASLGVFAGANVLTEAAVRLPRAAGIYAIGAYARIASTPATASRVLDSHVRIVAAFFLIVSAILIAGGGDIMVMLFGRGFADGAPTITLLAAALLPIGLVLTIASNALGTDRSRRVALLLPIMASLQLGLGVPLTAIFSAAGMAAADLILWSAAAIILLLRTRTHQAVSGATLVAVGVTGTLILALAFAVAAQPIPWQARAVFVGSAAAVAILFVLGDPERRVLRRLFSPAGVGDI